MNGLSGVKLSSICKTRIDGGWAGLTVTPALIGRYLPATVSPLFSLARRLSSKMWTYTSEFYVNYLIS